MAHRLERRMKMIKKNLIYMHGGLQTHIKLFMILTMLMEKITALVQQNQVSQVQHSIL